MIEGGREADLISSLYTQCCRLVLFSLPGLQELYSMSVDSSAMLSGGCGREVCLCSST